MSKRIRLLAAFVACIIGAPVAAQTQCARPANNPNDTNVATTISYSATIKTIYPTPIYNPATGTHELVHVVEIPVRQLQFDIGYDARGRLITGKSALWPEPTDTASSLATFRKIRNLHTEDTRLVTHEDGCRRFGASTDGTTNATPLSSELVDGSVAQSMIIPGIEPLRALGTVSTLANSQIEFVSTPRDVPGVGRVSERRRYSRRPSDGWELSDTTIEMWDQATTPDGYTVKTESVHRYAFTNTRGTVNSRFEAERAARATVRTAVARRLASPASSVKHLVANVLPQSQTSGLRRLQRSDANGPAIVYQHGFKSSAAAWQRMDGVLNQEFALGDRYAASLPWSRRIDDQRDLLVGLLGEQRVGPSILIGHSLGGIVTRRVAQLRPDLARGVITISAPNNGALVALTSRAEAVRGLNALGTSLASGCTSHPVSTLGCLMANLLLDPTVAGLLVEATFDTLLPVTADLKPTSPLIAALNATPEPFVRVGIENRAEPRWLAFRMFGDAVCSRPESGCGGEAWTRYVNQVYIALRSCTAIALVLRTFNVARWQFYTDWAAACSHVSGMMDRVDSYWNLLVGGGDGFIDPDGQNYRGANGPALRYLITNSDSHTGETKSLKVAARLNEALDRQFNIPKRIGASAHVSAASYARDVLAPDSIVAAFGSALASTTASASSVPLPTELGGTTVSVVDSTGAEHRAGMFFVSPAQVNYAMPPTVAPGPALITVRGAGGAVRTGSTTIDRVAPGLFTANADGVGAPQGQYVRVRGGVQTFEPVARFDDVLNKWVPQPVDLSNPTDEVYVVLYGTGFRARTDPQNVLLLIGEEKHSVAFAGAQGGVGLDQLNVRLSPSLAGSGEVDVALTVDGQPANIVRIAIR